MENWWVNQLFRLGHGFYVAFCKRLPEGTCSIKIVHQDQTGCFTCNPQSLEIMGKTSANIEKRARLFYDPCTLWCQQTWLENEPFSSMFFPYTVYIYIYVYTQYIVYIHSIYVYLYIYIYTVSMYIYIWVNYSNSLIWNMPIWWWFPLLTMIASVGDFPATCWWHR